MYWKIDYDSCCATYNDGTVKATIDGVKDSWGWCFVLDLSVSDCRVDLVWDCTPKNLKEAVCATKRALRGVVNDLCAASKAPVNVQ